VSDTSLVFNLVAREQVSETLGKVKEKFDAAATGIAAGVAGALGYGVAASMDMSAANAKLAAQLGIGPAEAAKLSKVSADVYANNWGDSTEQVNEAIKGVYQNIGDVSKAKGGLEGVTTKALALAQTFDQEVGPTTAAVGQMIKTGLAKNADEAFDIITKGFQSGVNKADDFLDTLNEYGVQFHSLGLNGQMATGLLSQGLKGGARDADLVADSLKEFNLRARDITSTAGAGFKSLGLNGKQMAADVAAGGPKATAALQATLDALRKYPDTSKKASIASNIFGTQSEDMQRSLESLDPSTAVSAMGKVAGAADRMSKTVSDSPAAALETFKRQATVKLAEVGGVFVSFAMDNKGAFGPLIGILGIVAGAILAVSVAQKIYATYTAIASAAQTIWNAEIWASTAALLANPMTWIVLAIIALIVVIVLIATKTTWFQTIWTTVWGAIVDATKATISGIGTALDWFASLPGKFAGWFGSAKDWAITKMVELVNWQAALPGRLWNALAGLAGTVTSRASGAFQSMKDAAVTKATSMINWVKGLPGRLANALGDLNGLLYNKGLDVVSGLWNGIQAMGGWLKATLINWAKDVIPGPIIKALGIGSPARVLAAEVGHWIPPGIAMGAEDNRDVLDKTMSTLVSPAVYRPTAQSMGVTPFTGAASTLGAGQGSATRLVFELRGGSRAFREFFQESVRVTSGGDVIKFAEG
jgi:phage-related minor tail protein